MVNLESVRAAGRSVSRSSTTYLLNSMTVASRGMVRSWGRGEIVRGGRGGEGGR